MPEKNGIEVAKALRAEGVKDKIVFLTATAHLALQAYEVRAYHYLLKPLDFNKLSEVIDDIVLEMSPDSQETIEIKARNVKVRIEVSNLMYVDKVRGASLIVNLSQIISMNREEITMDGGMVLYPPKSAYKELHEAWEKYWQEK